MESLTKTVGIGAMWSTVGSVGTKLVGLVTMFLVLGNLTVYQFGVIELVMSIPALLSLFTLPGLSVVTIADMGAARSRNDLGEMKRLFHDYMRLSLLAAVAGCGLVLAAPSLLMSGYTESMRAMVTIVAFQFIIASFVSGAGILYRVFLKFKWATWSTLLYELSKLVIIVILFSLYEPSPLTVVIASVGAYVCAFLILSPMSISLYRTFRAAQVTTRQGLFEPLRDHGKWGVISSYLGSFSQNVRPWLIKLTIGTEAVGLFGVAYGLIQHTFSLLPLAALVQPILPQYIERRDMFLKIFHKFLKYQLLTASALALVGVVVFPPIIAFLFPHYATSLSLYQFMLLAFVVYAVSPVVSGAINALRQQKSLTYALIMRTLITLVLLPPLALVWGLWGAAAEFLVTGILFQMERYRRLQRCLPELTFSFREMVTFDAYDHMILEKFAVRIPFIRSRVGR